MKSCNAQGRSGRQRLDLWLLGWAVWVCGSVIQAQADSTINATNCYAYGANIGWINARADVTHGAVLGMAYCEGFLWSANCGWICLGNGPAGGVQYANNSATDWGVNHDGMGNLTGYAYGANIGWIVFEQTYGKPHVDLATGLLGGSVYGANVGWISLSNSFAGVQTDRLEEGADSDHDGIPDWWEYSVIGTLDILSGDGADADGDGVSDVDEYHAGTNPLDPLLFLHILSLECGESNRVTWSCVPSRVYHLEYATALTNGATWSDYGGGAMIGEAGPTMSRDVAPGSGPSRFYRVRVNVPLVP